MICLFAYIASNQSNLFIPLCRPEIWLNCEKRSAKIFATVAIPGLPIHQSRIDPRSGADPGICVRGLPLSPVSSSPSPPALLFPSVPSPSPPILSLPFPSRLYPPLLSPLLLSYPLLFPPILSSSLPFLPLPLELGPLFCGYS